MFGKIKAKRAFKKRYTKHTYYNRKRYLFDGELDTWVDMASLHELYIPFAEALIADEMAYSYPQPEWFTVEDTMSEADAEELMQDDATDTAEMLTEREPDYVVTPEPTPAPAIEPVYDAMPSPTVHDSGVDSTRSSGSFGGDSYSSDSSSSYSSDSGSSGGCD